jgi:hypothetical protein
MKLPELHLTKTKIAGLAFGLTLAGQAFVPFLAQSASAGSLLNTMVRFDRLAQSQQTTGTVCAKTSAVNGTEASVKVTFPTGFTLGTAANFTVDTTNTAWPAGATAWLGINTATDVATQDVTFPSSDLATSTLYCFNWTNTAAVQTGTAGNYSGSVTTQASGPADIDSGNYTVTTVGAGADQVTVNATVNPTFSMTLSSNLDNLPTLDTAAVKTSTSAIQAQVSTNAANGWYIWGKDGNSPSGLHSTTASYTIPSNCSGSAGSNSTLSTNSEGFNLGATVSDQGSGSGGTTSVAAVFAGGSLGKGGGLCTSYQTIASSTGTANAAVIDMKNSASISGVTKPATDYQDIETFVGAGLF